MALDLHGDLFAQLSEHIDHNIECVSYGGVNVAIECVTCCVVLLDADKEVDAH